MRRRGAMSCNAAGKQSGAIWRDTDGEAWQPSLGSESGESPLVPARARRCRDFSQFTATLPVRSAGGNQSVPQSPACCPTPSEVSKPQLPLDRQTPIRTIILPPFQNNKRLFGL